VKISGICPVGDENCRWKMEVNVVVPVGEVFTGDKGEMVVTESPAAGASVLFGSNPLTCATMSMNVIFGSEAGVSRFCNAGPGSGLGATKGNALVTTANGAGPALTDRMRIDGDRLAGGDVPRVKAEKE